jgi:hypothetical protein
LIESGFWCNFIGILSIRWIGITHNFSSIFLEKNHQNRHFYIQFFLVFMNFFGQKPFFILNKYSPQSPLQSYPKNPLKNFKTIQNFQLKNFNHAISRPNFMHTLSIVHCQNVDKNPLNNTQFSLSKYHTHSRLIATKDQILCHSCSRHSRIGNSFRNKISTADLGRW